MLCKSIGWLLCIFVAVERCGSHSTTGSHTEACDRLRTDSAESSTLETAEDIKETAAVDLGALLDAGDSSVVTLVAGETRVVAHRAVLAARSHVFAATFHDDTPEARSEHVTITDMEGPVLRQLVAYCYTLQSPQLPDMAPQLLVAADRYGLSGLKAACEQQVARQLSVENAVATALLALRHCCHHLRQAAVAFIRAHSQKVVKTQGWADAVVNQRDSVEELVRLVNDPSTYGRRPATAGGGDNPNPGGRRSRAPDDDAPPPDPDDGADDIPFPWFFPGLDLFLDLIKAYEKGGVYEMYKLLELVAGKKLLYYCFGQLILLFSAYDETVQQVARHWSEDMVVVVLKGPLQCVALVIKYLLLSYLWFSVLENIPQLHQ